ncbi:hypothetical protein PsorP6_017429 [Peronosclerospora sorghi]|uniref:Uncharacterized protein n=1 Tax=Peronosclerospora sorghi TaxID=230839 RepID=A0ACC0WNM6_9STRA|nr:hypothetical protein PsorP6_017429 [Peronosclerospora sorghi]
MATVSGRHRILCSLKQLRNLKGIALKFPLHPPTFNHSDRKGEEQTTIKSRQRQDELLTGFAFLNEDTQQPHAFFNRCPHALLELDFDDSDFFFEGFIHCNTHAAFFGPSTGICLKGLSSSRTCLTVPTTKLN